MPCWAWQVLDLSAMLKANTEKGKEADSKSASGHLCAGRRLRLRQCVHRNFETRAL